MQKIALIGLLIVTSVYAERSAQDNQVTSWHSTRFEHAKMYLVHALRTGKEKTVDYCTWAWSNIPNTPEPVKEKLNTAGTWVSLKSTIAKTWLVRNTPAASSRLVGNSKNLL